MKIHDLKIEELHFDDVAKGAKKSELRKNDRDYMQGDMLILKEWQPLITSYTGRTLAAIVTHVYHGPNLPQDYVILSLRVMK